MYFEISLKVVGQQPICKCTLTLYHSSEEIHVLIPDLHWCLEAGKYDNLQNFHIHSQIHNGGITTLFLVAKIPWPSYERRAQNCWNISKIWKSMSLVNKRDSRVLMYLKTNSWCWKRSNAQGLTVFKNSNFLHSNEHFLVLKKIHTSKKICCNRSITHLYQGVL